MQAKSYIVHWFSSKFNKIFPGFCTICIKVLKKAIVYFCNLLKICENRGGFVPCKICHLRYIRTMHVTYMIHQLT